jgi:hypothetical protein
MGVLELWPSALEVSTMNDHFLGVIILETLSDTSIMHEVTVLRASDGNAPSGDPYPLWSRRLVRISAANIESLASKLAEFMWEDFYNHFVDDHGLVVVFKGKYYFLDKDDKSSWNEMIEYGKSVHVGQEWTRSIPLKEEDLL